MIMFGKYRNLFALCVLLTLILGLYSNFLIHRRHVKKGILTKLSLSDTNILANVYEKENLTVTEQPTVTLHPCEEQSPPMEMAIDIEVRLREVANNSAFLKNVLPGGTYIPPDCIPRERIALLVAYRNREDHLKTFVPYMHSFLQRQQVYFTIYVIEQDKEETFNKGLLLNVGFLTADSMDNYTCFFQHDVDMLPLYESNIYNCTNIPKHYIGRRGKLNYRPMYKTCFGGVVGFSRKHFVEANGYSNSYSGWGGEDDDMLARITKLGYDWIRVPIDIGVYKDLDHGRDKGNAPNPHRFALLKNATRRMRKDGLNSVKFNLRTVELKDLYTRVLVGVKKN